MTTTHALPVRSLPATPPPSDLSPEARPGADAVPLPAPELEEAALAKAERQAAATARRAARKAARAATPPPERDPAYDRLSLEDLRRVRTALAAEETRVSYWRRIIQARLDMTRQAVPEHAPVTDLTRALSQASVVHRRIQMLSIGPADDIPPLPDLAEVWARQVPPSDIRGTARLVADLERAEHTLSDLRSGLHRRIDAVTGELIARYREQPLLALQILPRDPLHSRL